jgi:hypothetical protein
LFGGCCHAGQDADDDFGARLHVSILGVGMVFRPRDDMDFQRYRRFLRRK